MISQCLQVIFLPLYHLQEMMAYEICNFKQLVDPRHSLIQPELQPLEHYWGPFPGQVVPLQLLLHYPCLPLVLQSLPTAPVKTDKVPFFQVWMHHQTVGPGNATSLCVTILAFHKEQAFSRISHSWSFFLLSTTGWKGTPLAWALSFLTILHLKNYLSSITKQNVLLLVSGDGFASRSSLHPKVCAAWAPASAVTPKSQAAEGKGILSQLPECCFTP